MSKKKKSEKNSGEQLAIDTEHLSLEEALQRLEDIVAKMDSESIDLEESIALFREGMELTKFCRQQIASAEQKVQEVLEDAEGNLTLEDFENE